MPNQRRYTAGPILAGLSVSQVVATLQVHLSNLHLYRALSSVTYPGFQPLPNLLTLPTLVSLKTAFCGGLFFTFTVGAFLSLAAFFSAWIWLHLLKKSKNWRYVLIGPWLLLMIAVNLKSFLPLVTVQLALVPLTVFALSLRLLPVASDDNPRRTMLTFLTPLIILALLWGTRLDGRMFITIRDHLLLSNAAGTRFNDFYYRHTLYPAEVFKSLDQKSIRTAAFETPPPAAVRQRLVRRLAAHDYFILKNPSVRADLTLVFQKNQLLLKHHNRKILNTDLGTFLGDPATVLKTFCKATDRHGVFRQFTFWSLLLGFPTLLYLALWSFLRAAAGLWLSLQTAGLAAGLTCLACGIALFVPLTLSRQPLQAPADCRKALASPHIAQRYWLANVLARSHDKNTYHCLIDLLDDPHPNVVCQAIEALGNRNERRARDLIMQKLKTSDHWYVQWYAYRALRKLGWKQTALH